MSDQSEETTKVQPGKPLNFFVVMNRSVVEVLLVTGTEMTQRQVHYEMPTPAWVTVHKSWKHRVYCTICRQLNELVSFPGSSAAFCFF